MFVREPSGRGESFPSNRVVARLFLKQSVVINASFGVRGPAGGTSRSGVRPSGTATGKAAMRQVDGALLLDELGIDHLKNASALGALSEQTIAYLMEKGRVYALRKGERLFEHGGPGDTFFVILKGSFAYYLPSNDHRSYIRDFHFGMEIGFVSMIALTPRPGTAIATCDSYVLEVTTDLFHSLHYERPLDFGVLLINLCRELARRILERQKSDQ